MVAGDHLGGDGGASVVRAHVGVREGARGRHERHAGVRLLRAGRLGAGIAHVFPNS